MNKMFSINLRQLSIGIMLLLQGCYSFNSNSFNNSPDKPGVSTTIERQIAEVTQTASDNKDKIETNEENEGMCPPFIMPILPSTPELPLKKLEEISPTNWKAIDQIERDNIIELRSHIVIVKQIITKAHNEYLTGCYERIGKKEK